MEFKKGFTLAEVLITLVIIGVIAAMTIPTLINKTNEQETVTAVKKAYSVLGQAYQKVIAENGEIIPSTLGADSAEATKTLGEMFSKQLSTSKICGMSTNEDCFAIGQYKYINGANFSDYNLSTIHFKMRLNDGMSVAFHVWRPSYLNLGNTESLSHAFSAVDVDINGDKGPNTYGKDMFGFHITKYGVLPYGTPNDTAYTLSDCKTLGHGCAAWVIKNGNMDYLRKDVSW